MIVRCLLAMLLTWFGARPPASADDVVWSPAAGPARVLRGGEERSKALTRGQLDVATGELLLLPARPGQVWSVAGVRSEVGLGFGEPVNGVVWRGEVATTHELSVAHLPMVRALVVRIEEPGRVRLAQKRVRTDELARQRFAEAAQFALRGGAVPEPKAAASARAMSVLRDLRAFLGPAVATQGPALAAMEPWWTDLVARLRFTDSRVGSPWRKRVKRTRLRVRPGSAVQVAAQPGEVIRLRVWPAAGEKPVLHVRQGGALELSLRFSGYAKAGAGGYAAKARVRRFWVTGRTVRLEAEHAALKVEVLRERPRATLRGWARGLFLARPGQSSSGDALARLIAKGPAQGFVGLTQGMARVASALWLWSGRNPREVARLAAPLLLASGEGTGALRLLALSRLLDTHATPPPEVCSAQFPDAGSELHAAVDLALAGLCQGLSESGHRVALVFGELSQAAPGDGLLRRIEGALRRRLSRLVWAQLAPRAFAQVRVLAVDDGRTDGLCRAKARARVLSAGAQRIEVFGTTARVLSLRSLGDSSASVRLGELEVSVQSDPSLVSRVRVGPGSLDLSVRGGPILLEGAGAAPRPCAELRQVVQAWPVVEELPLRAHADARPARSLELFSPEGRGALQGRYQLTVGQGAPLSLEALGRDEAARFSWEGALDAHAVLSTSAPVLARIQVAARRRAFAPPPASTVALDADEASLIQRVRSATRAVRGALSGREVPGRAEVALRRALSLRAASLVSLGQLSLARFDRTRLRALGEPVPALRMPSFGPLNLAAKLPELSASELALLRRAMKAEAAHAFRDAADAYAQLSAPAAQHRAATLLRRRRAEVEADELVLEAYARDVLASGSSAGPWTSRHTGRLRYVQPAAVDQSAGTMVERRARPPGAGSRHERTLRAFADAPDDAFVLGAEDELLVRLTLREPASLRIRAACEPLAEPPCTVQVRGAPGAVREGELLHLGAGSHALRFETDGLGIAWVSLCEGPDACGGEALPARAESLRRWFAASATDPLRLGLAGPGVVKLRLRSEDGPATLIARLGESVRRLQVGSDETEILLATLAPRAELTVSPLDGLVWVDVRVAEPKDARPAPREATGREPHRGAVATCSAQDDRGEPPAGRTCGPRLSGSTEQRPRPVPAAAREPTKAAPFSLMLTERFVAAQVADLDVVAEGAPFAETSLSLRRRVGRVLRTQFGAFARTRAGPLSLGAGGEVELTLAPRWLPRLSFSGRLVAQRFEPWALGTRSRLTALWSLPAGLGLSLLPWAALDHRSSERRVFREDAVDPDVYSRFSEFHDRAGFLGLMAYYRPLLDLSFSASGFVMTNPDFRSLDRWIARARVDALPIEALSPWLRAEYRVGYRYANPARFRGFLRHELHGSVALASFLSGSHRLSLRAVGGYIFGVNRAVGGLSLSWLWARGRGVFDLDSADTAFWRMQRGADVADNLALRPLSQPALDGTP